MTTQPHNQPPAGSPLPGDDGDPLAAPRPPLSPLLPARPKSRAGGSSTLLVVAVIVAAAGVAFAAGRFTAPTAAASTGRTFTNGANGGNFPNGGNGNGGRGFGGGFGGGLTVTGTVTAIGNDTITITTANGASATIDTTAATTYHRSTPASATDVTTGATVQIQVTGGQRFGGGFGGGAGGGSPEPVPSGAPRISASSVTITTP